MGKDLRLLSLDGGGVRGLSSLYLLKHLMETINPESPPKPCDCFDMIGGTSTGGLIAVMLGRLGMDVQSCIDIYTTLSDNAFQQVRHRVKLNGKTQARFDTVALEQEIKKVVADHAHNENALLKAGPDAKCKVFVCTTSTENRSGVNLTSYRSPRNVSDLLDVAKIWEACRATSAASTFFDPIKIGDAGETFIDGATGRNNPIRQLWTEARDVWPEGRLEDNINCIVSIGTGKPSTKPFGDGLLEVAKTLRDIATETEDTAEDFRRDHRDLAQEKRYFRFNVDKGLEDVGLEDSKQKNVIVAATRKYVASQEVLENMQACAETLLTGESRRSSRHNTLPINDKHRTSLRALFLTDPALDKARILSEKDQLLQGTCSWILDDPSYKRWINENQPPSLWIHGEAGKGKTMISISLIEELSDNGKFTGEARPTIAYFFCDGKGGRITTAVDILRGILWQTLSQQPESCEYLATKYGDQMDQLTESRNAIYALWDVLRNAMKHPTRQALCFIVDALDECESESRGVLLGLLEPYISGQAQVPDVKWLFTSRNVTSIKESLKGTLDVSLETNSFYVSENVKRFVEIKVRELADAKDYDHDLKATVADTLRQKAEGTFLWVSLACKELQKCDSIWAVETLKALPNTLDALYESILDQISNNKLQQAAQIAKDILRSLVVAFRPLTLRELATVANLPPRHRENRKYIIEYTNQCGSFLTILQDTAHLVHSSAKDYLLATATMDFSPGCVKENTALATRCFSYICSGVFRDGPIDLSPWSSEELFAERGGYRTVPDIEDDEWAGVDSEGEWISGSEDDEMELDQVSHERGVTEISALIEKGNGDEPYCLEYPVAFWMAHGRLSSEEAAQFDPQHEFFQHCSKLRDAWFSTYWSTLPDLRATPKKFSVLHLAAYSGILPLTMKILSSHVGNVNAKDSTGRTPLSWASEHGWEYIVDILLKSGADLNEPDNDGWTALQWAARHRHQAVVKLLIKCQGCDGQMELRWAIRNGHTSMARLLIENGVDILFSDADGRTALHLAAETGHEDIARLLIKDVDLNFKDRRGRAPLHEASLNGMKIVTALLLQSGADVSICDEDGRMAIHLAARNGERDIVELLLNHKSAINEQDKRGWTPLHSAAVIGDKAEILLLLNRGAAVNIQDEDGMTPLHWATLNEHQEASLALLARGADIWIKTKDSRTTLQEVVFHERKTAVKLLLDHEMKDEVEQTALYEASLESIMELLLRSGTDAIKQKHIEMVELLLVGVCDMALRATDGRMASCKAALPGYELVVRLLLGKYVDKKVRASDEIASGESSPDGYAEVVGLLLNKGARGKGELKLEAKVDHEKLARLLSESKPRRGMADEDMQNALHEAVSHGHWDIAQLLIKNGARPQSVLELVAHAGNYAMAKLLIECWPIGHPNKDEQGIPHRIVSREFTDFVGSKKAISNTRPYDDKYHLAKWMSTIFHDEDHMLATLDLAYIFGSLRVNGLPVNEKRDSELRKAISSGDLRTIEKLLKKGARPQSGLDSALLTRDLRIVIRLLVYWPSNDLGEEGPRVLHKAVSGRYKSMTKFLLVNRVSPEGALETAAQAGDKEIAEMLIEYWPRKDLGEEGQRALHKAVFSQNENITKLLLENSVSPEGALETAAQAGDKEMAKMLIEYWPCKNLGEEGQRALHKAVFSQNENITKLLLENSVSPEGALETAAQAGDKEMAKMLIEYWPCKNLGEEGERALQEAVSSGHERLVELLLQNGVGPYGQLELAARSGHAQVMVELLKKCLPGHLGKEGQRALHDAISGGHRNIAKLLLENRARLMSRLDLVAPSWNKGMAQLLTEYWPIGYLGEEGQRALHKAVSGGHENIVEFLLENGVCPEQDMLKIVASTKNKAIARLLIEHWPSLHPGEIGEMRLHEALSRGHEGLVELLHKNGAWLGAPGITKYLLETAEEDCEGNEQ